MYPLTAPVVGAVGAAVQTGAGTTLTGGLVVGGGFLVAVAVLLAAVPLAPPGRAARHRLRRVAASRTGTRQAGAARGGRRPDRVRLGAALGGLATAVAVGGWWGLLVGAGTSVLLDVALRRLEPADVRRRRVRETADLPLAADLLAAALRAGAPVAQGVEAVAAALDGPLGERLVRVGRTLRLGGEPSEAWDHLAPVTGADRLIAAAVRSAASGAALAGALSRLADDLRGDRSVAAEAAARRAGVLIVLPLGLCFLPAFILAGLVPVIVAVLGDVL
ncbi:secretion system protein [Micromonospora echinofusca]|uniref:Secretion system protein n=1 Tax=Micromonospora echinofusca TaxID=47858 RepID=A0ABS3VTX8_MICEH|nr:secretion system protein [Micromonospora echinofusca]